MAKHLSGMHLCKHDTKRAKEVSQCYFHHTELNTLTDAEVTLTHTDVKLTLGGQDASRHLEGETRVDGGEIISPYVVDLVPGERYILKFVWTSPDYPDVTRSHYGVLLAF